MSITETYVAQNNRIIEAEKIYNERAYKLRTDFYSETKEDKQAVELLKKKCMEVHFKNMNKKSCPFCEPHFPDGCYLDNDGGVIIRYDADHPNDIVDIKTTLKKLFGDES